MSAIRPGDRLRVVDAARPAHLKRMPFAEGQEVEAGRVIASGSVELRGAPGFWRPHRFEKL